MLVFELKAIAEFTIIPTWLSCPTGGQALKAECWHLNARGIRRKMTPESADFFHKCSHCWTHGVRLNGPLDSTDTLICVLIQYLKMHPTGSCICTDLKIKFSSWYHISITLKIPIVFNQVAKNDPATLLCFLRLYLPSLPIILQYCRSEKPKF